MQINIYIIHILYINISSINLADRMLLGNFLQLKAIPISILLLILNSVEMVEFELQPKLNTA